MSEELRQKGYLDKKGRVRGVPVGPYEGFNIGATTLDQLRRFGIVPDRNYGRFHTRKPDGIVVDRRAAEPIVKFVVDFKDRGILNSAEKFANGAKKSLTNIAVPYRVSSAVSAIIRLIRGFLFRMKNGKLFDARMTIR